MGFFYIKIYNIIKIKIRMLCFQVFFCFSSTVDNNTSAQLNYSTLSLRRKPYSIQWLEKTNFHLALIRKNISNLRKTKSIAKIYFSCWYFWYNGCHLQAQSQGTEAIIDKGPSINYVVSKLAIFDPLPPLSRLFSK